VCEGSRSLERGCGKPRVVRHDRRPQAGTYGSEGSEMRVSLSTCGSPAGVWR
jgi:hypothetical protein